MDTEIPITEHPKLPHGVPLIASFHDDRNRLSYYFPRLRALDDVRVPVTKFVPVEGDSNSFLTGDWREVTKFMMDVGLRQAFVRGDYSSAKYDGKRSSKIESQDRYNVEGTVLEMFRQLSRSKRRIGGRIAVREWIPHDVEVRYFIRHGRVITVESTDDIDTIDCPNEQADTVADEFDTFAWSCDFIRHETTEQWYCIDMGLDGLYWDGDNGWVAISEHHDESLSPERHADRMPLPTAFEYRS